MYPWTGKSPLNCGSHPDADTGPDRLGGGLWLCAIRVLLLVLHFS